jgi:hypothetical protein
MKATLLFSTFVFKFKAKKHKLEDVSFDVAMLVSHATQEYLRNILEKLNSITQHRIDLSIRVRGEF